MSSTFNAIQGLNELRLKLGALPAKVEIKILRSAWRKAANTMKDAVKAEAPVGDSGELKKSIKVTSDRAKFGRIKLKVRVPATRVSKKFSGGGYPYALAVESGHEFPGKGKNTQKKRITPHESEFGTSFVRPHPFVRPAWEANKDKLLDAFASEAGKGIERVAKEKV